MIHIYVYTFPYPSFGMPLGIDAHWTLKLIEGRLVPGRWKQYEPRSWNELKRRVAYLVLSTSHHSLSDVAFCYSICKPTVTALHRLLKGGFLLCEST